MQNLYKKPNLIFLVAVRCRYINASFLIMKKLNAKCLRKKLLKAVTECKCSHNELVNRQFIEYRVYGKLHREDGPARTLGDSQQWYINGKRSGLGYYQEHNMIIRNAPDQKIALQRKWINFRIKISKNVQILRFIKIKLPIHEEIFLELEAKYYIKGPHNNYYDPIYDITDQAFALFLR